MKRRSSTEMFASSSGRKRPLRYTVMKNVPACDGDRVLDAVHRCSRAEARIKSLEPQSDGVPRAPEEARERHLLEGNQRVFSDWLGVERDLDQADALSSCDWCKQGLNGLLGELQ